MRPKAVPIASRGTPRPAPPPRRRRAAPPKWLEVFLTAVMVLALPVGLVVRDSVRAAEPTLAVSGQLVPGGQFTIAGSEFRPRASLILTWDGSEGPLSSVRADPSGSFSISAAVPPSATAGGHEIAAVERKGQGRGAPTKLASLAVTVVAVPTSATRQIETPVPSALPSTSQHEHEPAAPSPTQASDDGGGEESTPAPTVHAHETPAPAAAAQATPTPTSGHAHTPPPASNPPASNPPVTGASSPGCSGYPEPRIWLESQSWWLQTPGASGTDFGHAHVGTCFPYGVPVSGQVAFDVKITLFHNPGVLVRLQPHIATGSGSVNYEQPVLNWKAPNGTGELWQRVVIDTTRVSVDGLQELRMFAQIKEPDGKEMHVSTGWQLLLANGNGRSDYRHQGLGFTEGRGWYTDVDYTVARFSSVIPPAVSGVWKFNVDLKPGAGGIPVTSHTVAVDPNHHQGQPGWVVKSGGGEYVGSVSIDTRQLANGSHRLMLKADAAASSGSTNSGILVLFFNVQN